MKNTRPARVIWLKTRRRMSQARRTARYVLSATGYFLSGDLSWCAYKHALKYRPIAVACDWGALIIDPDFEV
jgi:hypothetical protein